MTELLARFDVFHAALAVIALGGPVLVGVLRRYDHAVAASILGAIVGAVEAHDDVNLKRRIEAAATAAGVEPQLNALVKRLTEGPDVPGTE